MHLLIKHQSLQPECSVSVLPLASHLPLGVVEQMIPEIETSRIGHSTQAPPVLLHLHQDPQEELLLCEKQESISLCPDDTGKVFLILEEISWLTF